MPQRFSVENGSFAPLTSLDECTQAAVSFLDICGRDAWTRRVGQLVRDIDRSPYEAKIVSDHHWVEVELALQMESLALAPSAQVTGPDALGLAVLSFANMVVALHAGLPLVGRRSSDLCLCRLSRRCQC